MGDGSHVVCCVCDAPIPRDRWFDAFTWIDPGGIPCVACRRCLVRLGEFELHLTESPW